MQASDSESPIKARSGRKTKYSPALINKLISYIESGLNNKQACQAAGICENTLAAWRREYADFDSKIEAAREVLRSKVLAEIKAAGAKGDWRAHAEFLRLAFPELRYGNGPSVSVAIQQNTMEFTDPERAELIERRNRALAAAKPAEPPQLEDTCDPREVALEAERKLAQGACPAADPTPERLKERPPTSIVVRADTILNRLRAEGWKSSDDSYDVDDVLDG